MMIRRLKNGFIALSHRLRWRINARGYFKSLGVKIGKGTVLYGSHYLMFSTEPWLVTIGENCHITAGVKFQTHDGGTLVIQDAVKDFVVCGDIVVGNNVYIGERTMILPGVHIGDNVIIGCGSVVTKDLPANTVCAGVPARVIRSRDEYIHKVKDIMAGNNPRYYSDLDYLQSLNPRNKKKKDL